MWKQSDFTAKYIMSCKDGCFRFEFTCLLCESNYTTGLISAASVEEAFRLAADEARKHFNRCQKCGEWVCDQHYNEDDMMCIACAPRLRQT